MDDLGEHRETPERGEPPEREPSDAAPGEQISAGELGEAVDGEAPTRAAGQVEVIIGELPDEHDLSRMLWTARCTFPSHGLLGTVDDRQKAESLKEAHLQEAHDGPQP
jgi:hypothetical protein